MATTAGTSPFTAAKFVDRAGRARGWAEELPAERRRAGPVVELVFPAMDSAWAVEVMCGVVDSGLDVVVSPAAGRRTSGVGRRGRPTRSGPAVPGCCR